MIGKHAFGMYKREKRHSYSTKGVAESWTVVFPQTVPRVAIAVDTDHASVWDVKTGLRLGLFPHQNELRCSQLSPDGNELITVDWKGRIYSWDIESFCKRTDNPELVNLRIDSVSFSPSGNRLLLLPGSNSGGIHSTSGKPVRIWDRMNRTTFALIGHMKQEREGILRDTIVGRRNRDTDFDLFKREGILTRNTIVGAPTTAPPQSVLELMRHVKPGNCESTVFSETPLESYRRQPADLVECSVFGPTTVPRQDRVFLVQVLLYSTKDKEKVEDIAVAADGEAQLRGAKKVRSQLNIGDKVTVELAIPGLDVANAFEDIVWDGDPEVAQFEVGIPDSFSMRVAIGRVTLCLESTPIGHISFKILFDDSSACTHGQERPKEVGDETRIYRKAFISYASKDRDKVLARVQMLVPLGITYFQDVLDLEPGARWERELYRNIDQVDLFLLFWSSNARDSKWVHKELAYAMQRSGPDGSEPPAIYPIILEGPPVPKPWPEIAHMHFDDRILRFMDS